MGRKSAEEQHRAAGDGFEHSHRHDGAAPSSICQLFAQISRFQLFRPRFWGRSPFNACSPNSEAVLEFTNPRMQNIKSEEPLGVPEGPGMRLSLECSIH